MSWYHESGYLEPNVRQLSYQTITPQKVCLTYGPLLVSSLGIQLTGVHLCPSITVKQRQFLYTQMSTNDTLGMITYSIGNQSPQSSLTFSMSSWQRKRSWTSLRAVGGTTSLIHTCRSQQSAQERWWDCKSRLKQYSLQLSTRCWLTLKHADLCYCAVLDNKEKSGNTINTHYWHL